MVGDNFAHANEGHGFTFILDGRLHTTKTTTTTDDDWGSRGVHKYTCSH